MSSKAIVALFALTGLLGLLILAEDRILWSSAPSHAYVLVAFVLVDFVVAILLLAKPSSMIFKLAAGWAGLRIVLQIGDIFLAPTLSLTYSQFADYLFNPMSTTPPNPTGIPSALVDLIVICELIILGLALSSRKTASTSST